MALKGSQYVMHQMHHPVVTADRAPDYCLRKTPKHLVALMPQDSPPIMLTVLKSAQGPKSYMHMCTQV